MVLQCVSGGGHMTVVENTWSGRATLARAGERVPVAPQCSRRTPISSGSLGDAEMHKKGEPHIHTSSDAVKRCRATVAKRSVIIEMVGSQARLGDPRST